MAVDVRKPTKRPWQPVFKADYDRLKRVEGLAGELAKAVLAAAITVPDLPSKDTWRVIVALARELQAKQGGE